jgi:hypothetical protein
MLEKIGFSLKPRRCVVVSPTAKLRIQGHRIRAARLPDESRYGEKEVKKRRYLRRCDRDFVRVARIPCGGGGGGALSPPPLSRSLPTPALSLSRSLALAHPLKHPFLTSLVTIPSRMHAEGHPQGGIIQDQGWLLRRHMRRTSSWEVHSFPVGAATIRCDRWRSAYRKASSQLL